MSARFVPASDRSLAVYLGDAIDLAIHRDVVRLMTLLASRPIAGVVNLHPSYRGVLVVFDPLSVTHQDIEREVLERLAHAGEAAPPASRVVEIPVCYGGDFGPDLESVAAIRGLSPAQVVDMHSAASYTVYFLGFVPGFAYLGGLPLALATPRLETPRKQVPAGSVAIGGSQTGVYPRPTPGGWRIIGRTPAAMFADGRSLVEIGDTVRFVPARPEDVRWP